MISDSFLTKDKNSTNNSAAIDSVPPSVDSAQSLVLSSEEGSVLTSSSDRQCCMFKGSISTVLGIMEEAMC